MKSADTQIERHGDVLRRALLATGFQSEGKSVSRNPGLHRSVSDYLVLSCRRS